MSSERLRRKELGRRFIPFALSIFFICATLATDFWGEGIADPISIIDYIGTMVVCISIIYVVVARWNDVSLNRLKRQNNVIVVLLLASFMLQLYGYVTKLGTTYATNNVHIIFGTVLAILNRFA